MCVLTTAKRVIGLQRYRECFDNREACQRLAELCRVRFDHRKSCGRLLAEVRSAHFDHSKACKDPAEFRGVRFDNRKVCKRLA